jgi:tripartite-type tricarboxylate transporter receptor subunit TctC
LKHYTNILYDGLVPLHSSPKGEKSMRNLFVCLATSIAAVFSGLASAQGSYPARPVNVVIPGAPGAGFELIGRIFFPKLSENVGQTFVLDFRPGAAQTLATAYVAKSAPDGYTLLFTSGTHAVGQILYKDLSYDPVKSFAPIAQTTTQTIALLINSGVPAKNVQEYIAWAKANKGKVNWGTAGNGTLSHFSAAWFNLLGGTEATYIPYKSAGPLLTSIISGEVHIGTVTLSSARPHINSGKIRVLGVTSIKRNPLAPDVPTVAEQGVAGFDYSQWQGLLAPSGTPSAIVTFLNGEMNKVTRSADVVERVAKMGDQAVGSTPEEFRNLIANDVARWKKVYEQTQLKLSN